MHNLVFPQIIVQQTLEGTNLCKLINDFRIGLCKRNIEKINVFLTFAVLILPDPLEQYIQNRT